MSRGVLLVFSCDAVRVRAVAGRRVRCLPASQAARAGQGRARCDYPANKEMQNIFLHLKKGGCGSDLLGPRTQMDEQGAVEDDDGVVGGTGAGPGGGLGEGMRRFRAKRS